MTDNMVPEGFGPIFRTSPLLDCLGGVYSKGIGKNLEIGLLALPAHTNSRGSVHGGVLATVADTGLGYMLAFSTDPARRLVTLSLTIDYVKPASPGDWITVHLQSKSSAPRHVFATGALRRAGEDIASIRAIFVEAVSEKTPS